MMGHPTDNFLIPHFPYQFTTNHGLTPISECDTKTRGVSMKATENRSSTRQPKTRSLRVSKRTQISCNPMYENPLSDIDKVRGVC